MIKAVDYFIVRLFLLSKQNEFYSGKEAVSSSAEK